MAAKLGQLLIASNIITEEQLKHALTTQKKEGGRLGTNLTKLGYLTEEKLVSFLSKQFGVPAINISEYSVDPSVVKLIPIEMARKYLIMPITRVGATLTIAMADPSNVFAIDDIKFMTGYNVEVVVANESSLLTTISKHYARGGSEGLVASKKTASQAIQAKDYTLTEDDLDQSGPLSSEETPTVDVEEFDNIVGSALDTIDVVDERDDSEDVTDVEAPIVKLVNGIFVNAIKAGASDIHIEPYETSMRVRYRIDRVAYTVMNLPPKIKNALTSRVKIMARLDIAERGLPQDGSYPGIRVRLNTEACQGSMSRYRPRVSRSSPSRSYTKSSS